MSDARSVTIEDVATKAGVSVATVSRALRGLPNVAPSTRERVLLAASALDYRPDPAASRLAAGRTRTIAMAVPVLNSWYFSQVMAGAEAVLTEAGYDLLLFAVDTTRADGSAWSLAKRADGLILVDLHLRPNDLARIMGDDLPIVTIGFSLPGHSSVRIDDYDVGRMATRHLLRLGHRSIGLLSGLPDDHLRFTVPDDRRRGYLEALREHEIEHRPELERAGNFSVSGGAEAMDLLLRLDEPPTAVFAMSDEMAFGALRTLDDAGLAVPGDVSVIGVDDHDVAPVLRLTTVHQDVPDHGARAASILIDHLRGELTTPVRIVPAVRLIQRGTTAPRR